MDEKRNIHSLRILWVKTEVTHTAQQHDFRGETLIFVAVTVVAALIGVSHSLSLRYMSDDSFVAFRYARNLLDGLGLVYNAGERVEGYTNFLWVVVVAAGMRLGFDPVDYSAALGIGFFALTLALVAYLSWKFRAAGKRQLIPLPVAAIALALHRDISAHATSGMETSLFTFLVLAGFALLLLARSWRAYAVAGVAFVLAIMCRPDGIIFVAASAVYLLFVADRPARSLVAFLLPLLILFLPYWVWRWQYYGFFFPNTFYAKSISLPYYSQGLTYLWLYVKTYYVLALPLILWVVLASRRTEGLGTAVKSWWGSLRGRAKPLLLASLFIIPYALFIVRIGGDFMFARFFIPITPLAYFAAELLIKRTARGIPGLLLAALLAAGTLLRINLYTDDSFVGYVADEERYFNVDEPLAVSQDQGALLKKYFQGLPVKVAFWAGQLRVAYYADPALAIEASAGLTDTAIAHRPIAARGRPGHEKNATLEYLMRRKVNFYIGPTNPPPPGQLVLNSIVFDSVRARIIVYDNSIMSRLAVHPEIKFVRLPEYLDTYLGQIASYPREKVRQDYAFLRAFYFQCNDDSVRERKFLSALAGEANPPSHE